MDRFHADIGQLVGHVVVGGTDDDSVFQADEGGVGRGQVEFLVDHGLVGLDLDGDLAEGDFGVAAIELAHDAFRALGVAGGHDHAVGDIHALEAVVDALVNRPGLVVVKAGQVHQDGRHAIGLEDFDRVEGAVRFADGGEDLACCQQHVVAVQVAAGQHAVHGLQVVTRLGNALVDEGIGHVQRQADIGEAGVDLLQAGAQIGQCAGVVLVVREQGVNAGLAGFLVFQQLVGDAGVGRHHVDATVDAGLVIQHDVTQHIAKGRHRRSTNFFNRNHAFLLYVSACRRPAGPVWHFS